VAAVGSAAERAAEKVVEDAKKLTSGAEAQGFFQRPSGPTEVGPFPKPRSIRLFPASGEAVADFSI
jgi:hypothetical protein